MKSYLKLFTFTLISFVFSCTSIKTYPDATGPRFSGDYREFTATFEDTVTVATFNIANAVEISRAISELSNSPELSQADIILLQEMDQSGTDRIASALKTTYIYYPATNKDGKNFGNAILSMWPLSNDRKYVLPYDYPFHKSPRAAVSAVVKIDDLAILTFSVHTHTILLSEEKRLAQVDSLVNDISQKWHYVVVGGDFNSPGTSNVEAIEKIFKKHGFRRASEKAGPTVEVGPLELTLDHIFTKGFRVAATGKLESSRASDHLPVWVRLIPQNPEY